MKDQRLYKSKNSLRALQDFIFKQYINFNINPKYFIKLNQTVQYFFYKLLRHPSMDSIIKIRLDQNTDNLIKYLLSQITWLRQAIALNRDSKNLITYQIYFFPKTRIYPKDNKTLTAENDYFIVKISPKTIYPETYNIQKNQFVITHVSKNGNVPIIFDPTYTGVYCVLDAIGILVAEQIRFNTLQLSLQKHKIQAYNSEALFNELVKRYLEKVYKNWEKGSADEKVLPEDVRVVLKKIK